MRRLAIIGISVKKNPQLNLACKLRKDYDKNKNILSFYGFSRLGGSHSKNKRKRKYRRTLGPC